MSYQVARMRFTKQMTELSKSSGFLWCIYINYNLVVVKKSSYCFFFDSSTYDIAVVKYQIIITYGHR